jgi:hypothetical protein
MAESGGAGRVIVQPPKKFSFRKKQYRLVLVQLFEYRDLSRDVVHFGSHSRKEALKIRQSGSLCDIQISEASFCPGVLTFQDNSVNDVNDPRCKLSCSDCGFSIKDDSGSRLIVDDFERRRDRWLVAGHQGIESLPFYTPFVGIPDGGLVPVLELPIKYNGDSVVLGLLKNDNLLIRSMEALFRLYNNLVDITKHDRDAVKQHLGY